MMYRFRISAISRELILLREDEIHPFRSSDWNCHIGHPFYYSVSRAHSVLVNYQKTLDKNSPTYKLIEQYLSKIGLAVNTNYEL